MSGALRVAIFAGVLFFAAGIAIAHAANELVGPNVIRPAYYQGVDKTLTTTDQANLAAYRNQLEVQQRAQQLRLYQGSSRPRPPLTLSPMPVNPAVLSRDLFQTQSELNRVNSLLRSAHTAQSLAPINPVGSSPTQALGFKSFNPGMPAFPH